MLPITKCSECNVSFRPKRANQKTCCKAHSIMRQKRLKKEQTKRKGKHEVKEVSKFTIPVKANEVKNHNDESYKDLVREFYAKGNEPSVKFSDEKGEDDE